jgi:phosphoadenosine phosphosulfate reductase
MTIMLSDQDLETVAASFEDATPEEIVRWAAQTFGDRLCLTTSLTDAVLVDLVARVAPGTEVIFLDTQYHFPETLATLEVVRERYPVKLTVRRPDVPLDDLWRTDTDGCCAVRKVAQLDAALSSKAAWLSGLRRDDSPDRADTPIVQRDKRGLVRLPLRGVLAVHAGGGRRRRQARRPVGRIHEDRVRTAPVRRHHR